MGTPNIDNTPGARTGCVAAADSAGKVRLFGGFGKISLPALGSMFGSLNDVWTFDGTRWTWIAGNANAGNPGAAYGTRGVPSPTNTPGGRNQGVGGIDSAGRLWISGGMGRDASPMNEGFLNDLWRFSP